MLSIKLLCLLLLCYRASCSSGRAKESQYCGDDKFYCPSTKKCFDRNLRCTGSKICVDSEGKEAKCFEASSGRYNYYRKQSPLSRRKKRSVDFDNPRHWFLEYRGFVYEFGSYGFQELDVNDPNYKYGPGREEVVKEELIGTSTCTRDDVLGFKDEFIRANPEYHLWTNNCQDFVRLLEKRLKNHCSARKRRLNDEKESLKSKCFVRNQTSSSSMLVLNWKRFALFGTPILFTMFCM